MKLKRAVIQKTVSSILNGELDKAANEMKLDLKDADTQRRIFRAVVSVAAERLLNAGAQPQLVVNEAARAVVELVKERQEGALQMGQPFGPMPPASA